MNSENFMKYLQEIGLFSSIVWWCILIWVIVLNFQAFVWTVQDLIRWVPKIAVAVWQSSKDVRLWSLSATVYHPSAPQNMIKQEWYKKTWNLISRDNSKISNCLSIFCHPTTIWSSQRSVYRFVWSILIWSPTKSSSMAILKHICNRVWSSIPILQIQVL